MEAHLLRSQDADHVAHRKRNQAPSIIAMFEKQKRTLTESMEAAAPGGDPARQRTDAASDQLMDLTRPHTDAASDQPVNRSREPPGAGLFSVGVDRILSIISTLHTLLLRVKAAMDALPADVAAAVIKAMDRQDEAEDADSIIFISKTKNELIEEAGLQAFGDSPDYHCQVCLTYSADAPGVSREA